MSKIPNWMINFFPRDVKNSVTELTIDWMNDRGIKAVISDLDNSLAKTNGYPSKEVIAWKENLSNAGIQFIIATHNHRHRFLEEILNDFNMSFDDIVFSFPPRPFQHSIKKAMAKFGPEINPYEILFIDDILFGILPANQLGCFTVLVKPIDLWSESKHPLLPLARIVERGILFPKLGIQFP